MFVTRKRHDEVVGGITKRLFDAFDARDKEFAALHARWRESDARKDARYDALLEKYHALRLQGATVPEPAPKGLPKKDADPVAEVIADVAGNNSALRKQLGSYARAEKRKGTPTAEITHAILHWGSDEDGTPE